MSKTDARFLSTAAASRKNFVFFGLLTCVNEKIIDGEKIAASNLQLSSSARCLLWGKYATTIIRSLTLAVLPLVVKIPQGLSQWLPSLGKQEMVLAIFIFLDWANYTRRKRKQALQRLKRLNGGLTDIALILPATQCHTSEFAAQIGFTEWTPDGHLPTPSQSLSQVSWLLRAPVVKIPRVT
jgi:hypothetical protein